MFDESAQLLALLVSKIRKTQAETHGYLIVRHFPTQFEPRPVRKSYAKGKLFTEAGFARSVDKTAALREVSNARGAVCMSVPNGLQRDFHSLFSTAFAHIQFWDLGTVHRVN